ncbi:MAG: DUF1015 family protein [Verrucomicrobiales bacterium]|nr:DUF1015 family protein [Verrucomicrobiales bacterium]
MATIEPFAALRPRPDLAARLCELPYDVVSSEEARQQAAGNPLSFFHVSRAEIDLPSGTDPHAPEVYAKARENFERLIAGGALRQDAQRCFYLYRQIMGAHAQVGIVGVASCEDYLRGVIKKHELTRPDKEEDRRRHIETLNAQTGPAFLIHRADDTLAEFVCARTEREPEVDFTAADGVRHSAWTVADAEGIALVRERFAQMPALYIADGHHRTAAAAQVFLNRGRVPCPGTPAQPPPAFAFFLAVIFPHDRVQVLPYHRALKDLNGLTPAQVFQKLETVFETLPADTPVPSRPHEVGFYMAGRWRRLRFRPALTQAGAVWDRLDVALLQQHVLEPVFGIADPRTSERIEFVGGIRGTAELERLVDSGACACAFALHPTSVEELMQIADAGRILPPKSTWFEPKLRDGMFCHLI